MHTSRNCVTDYIHKFNVIVLGRELCWKGTTLIRNISHTQEVILNELIRTQQSTSCVSKLSRINYPLFEILAAICTTQSQPLILSILSVDCIPTAECHFFFATVQTSLFFALLLKSSLSLDLCDWYFSLRLDEYQQLVYCSSRLDVLLIASRYACIWLSSRWFQMLATGLPNDWVDQTMSYQLIQTTSFAMHPRLIEYNAEALVWMYKLPAGILRLLVINAKSIC
ncbi:hypothetical protein F511_39862 [Dorcoceras hygrometricum]|uniref:Uncharacterized protein n=1 Tax=Dorcoceras hygrometricum TaxID=472368 RepID=A0A2Z7AY88_9LAMI|nr:hypothetical protein F511_39862 [Dorcoceras hygrometricum]